MTPDEIRIAVAECCGWTDFRQSKPWEFSDNPESRVVLCGYWPSPNGGGVSAPIANYTASLDACAAFEKTLTADERVKYGDQLAKFYQTSEYSVWWQLITATPLQRCEAFLRVKGKWREAPAKVRGPVEFENAEFGDEG